jgi:hypothetical protein
MFTLQEKHSGVQTNTRKVAVNATTIDKSNLNLDHASLQLNREVKNSFTDDINCVALIATRSCIKCSLQFVKFDSVVLNFNLNC